MKFILSFIVFFFMVSVMMTAVLGPSLEMTSYMLVFDCLYAVVSILTWYFINTMIKSDQLPYLALRLFLGLVVLNLFSYFLIGAIPTLSLFYGGNKYGNWNMSFSCHVAYLSSYTFGMLAKLKLTSLPGS